VKKRVVKLLLGFICLSLGSAHAEDLAHRFSRAYDAVRHIKVSVALPTTTGGEASSALNRLNEISNKFPSLSSAILSGTADPTEQRRQDVCRLAGEIQDLIRDASRLDGYDLVAEVFNSYATSVGEVRAAMNCTAGGGPSASCLANPYPINNHPSCEAWAARGECSVNPNYMWPNCCAACSGSSSGGQQPGRMESFTCSWGGYVETYYYDAPGRYHTVVYLNGRFNTNGRVVFKSPTEASAFTDATGAGEMGVMTFDHSNRSSFSFKMHSLPFVSSRWNCTGSFVTGF
jgi:hypothetical protein